MNGTIEPIIGRYVHVEIDGETHRIYFEENGAGIPLVCLHTAGSDARQWRYLLADEEFSKSFRIIAFDMPFHGKSNPPASWDGTEYQLTTARYTETIRAFCRTLELDRPVVIGCSIGGRILLNLSIEHAAEFRALISLEAADFQAPWYDTAWLNRPDVHGGEVCAALVAGLIAPQSPQAARMKRCGPTNRADRGFSKVISISIASTVICVARSARSVLKYVHSIFPPASMISPARRKIRNGPLPPLEAPVW
jgi:pimeloyl-ACP methyl ester carboxylesterase